VILTRLRWIEMAVVVVTRSVALIVLLLPSACRFHFDARTDAGQPDDASTDGPICHSGTWATPQLVTLSTISHESDPTLTIDGLEMFYTSNRSPSQGYAIWTARRASPSAAFGPPSLVAELDTAASDQDPSISADGTEIYFDSDRVNGVVDIFVARRAGPGSSFEAATPLVIAGDSATPRETPSLSLDGLDLYYSRAGLEIAYAHRPSTAGGFTFVRELDEINAAQTDATPAITPDGLELFFESYRTGSASLFTARRASVTDPFGPPEELSSLALAVGGSASGGPEVSADGRTLYLFIDTTSIDLYVTTRVCP
jgi:Tol biopolymer transport system component